MAAYLFRPLNEGACWLGPATASMLFWALGILAVRGRRGGEEEEQESNEWQGPTGEEAGESEVEEDEEGAILCAWDDEEAWSKSDCCAQKKLSVMETARGLAALLRRLEYRIGKVVVEKETEEEEKEE